MSEALCREADSEAPCRFASVCHASRQRLQAGYRLTLGQLVQVDPPLRGMDCWAFVHLLQEAAYPTEQHGEPPKEAA